jgi:phosphate uptake regulator
MMPPRSRQLDRLAQRILVCGALTEDAMASAVRGLVNRDTTLAATSVAITVPIAAVMADLQGECLAVLTSRHSVAADLRFVLAVLRLADDLASIVEIGHTVARQVHDAVTAGPGDVPTEGLDSPRRRVHCGNRRECSCEPALDDGGLADLYVRERRCG